MTPNYPNSLGWLNILHHNLASLKAQVKFYKCTLNFHIDKSWDVNWECHHFIQIFWGTFCLITSHLPNQVKYPLCYFLKIIPDVFYHLRKVLFNKLPGVTR